MGCAGPSKTIENNLEVERRKKNMNEKKMNEKERNTKDQEKDEEEEEDLKKKVTSFSEWVYLDEESIKNLFTSLHIKQSIEFLKENKEIKSKHKYENLGIIILINSRINLIKKLESIKIKDAFEINRGQLIIEEEKNKLLLAKFNTENKINFYLINLLNREIIESNISYKINFIRKIELNEKGENKNSDYEITFLGESNNDKKIEKLEEILNTAQINDDKENKKKQEEYKLIQKETQNIQKKLFSDTQKTFQLSNSIMNINYNIEKEKQLMDINEKLKQKYLYKTMKNNFIYGQCETLLKTPFKDTKTDIEKIKSLKQNIDELLKEKETISEKEINDLTKIKEEEETKFKKYYEEKLQKGEIIIRGLSNVGATCYMNSTLQCLSNVGELTEYLLKENKNSDIKEKLSNKDNLIYYYKEVIENLWAKSKNSSYAPKKFKEVLSEKNELFKGVAANDSKDLILYLLETFHSELNSYKEKNNSNNNNNEVFDQTNDAKMLEIFKKDYLEKNISIISDLFHGILKVKSICYNCLRKNYTYQSFNLLEFPLEETVKYIENQHGNPYCFINNKKTPFLNLIECFEYYRSLTVFAGNNQMYCNYCCQNTNALYYSSIKKTPEILVIILNRGKAAKYDCTVNFGKYLNIEEFAEDKDDGNIYELFGVIVHYGPSSMSGHFIAFCINRTEQSWYKYNDACAERCKFDNEYLKGMPYILFYRKIKSK